MKHIVILSLLTLCVSACSQLGLKQEETQTVQKPANDMAALAPAAGGNAAIAGNPSCHSQASSKLALFDKPDTYPISEAEKKNAYDALYSECLKGLELRANDPKPHFEQNALDTGLANLSPAAGGQAASSTTSVTTHSTPAGAGVMVIDTAQFANLSPAAGGNGVINGVASNGQPVIIVQAPNSAAPAVVATPPVPTRAAAIPVAPVAETTTTTVTTQETPAPAKPRKQAKAKTSVTAKTTDKRSRFAKNAVAVGNLNSYQPSAGSMIDSAVTTNRPAQKD